MRVSQKEAVFTALYREAVKCSWVIRQLSNRLETYPNHPFGWLLLNQIETMRNQSSTYKQLLRFMR